MRAPVKLFFLEPGYSYVTLNYLVSLTTGVFHQGK
jgi:hypothetical protein